MLAPPMDAAHGYPRAMPSEREQLEAVIQGLESQRGLLGDAFVDAGLAPLRARLAAVVAGQTGPGGQTLKQVTILFMDVVGSTALSQQLDAEDTHAVMDNALVRCTAIVHAHGGKVLQYAGDSLLAVFGAGLAREDDAERAVRAGLALLAEAQAVAQDVLRLHGRAGFEVRAGVHTGGVLLGGGVAADGSISGLAVNVAARMEQSAPAGTLRISHDTYRHVRGVFDVQPQPPLAVKGVDPPVVTYLVQRAKPRAFRVGTRGIEGVETRMVGRDAELEQLQQLFSRLFIEPRTEPRTEPRLAAVTVVADAGLGKSRLLYEFQNWAEARPESFYIFQGRANPQTRNQPYGLLRDILAWRLQVADGDSMDAAKQKIVQGIAPLFVADDGPEMAEAHAHLLGHLIGLDFSESRHIAGIKDDPRQIRNRGFNTAAQLLRRVSAQGDSPVVLQLEDLHWADDGSLDFLQYLAEVNRDVPMLMLGLTRPTLFERRADWCSGTHERIELTALDKGASRVLVNELLKKLVSVPDALRELVTGSAEGNPFYMEELVKMLVDQGALETHGPGSERWTLHPQKLLATQLPPTLTGVLQARLDGLPAAEKWALQQASVIGSVFWDAALAALDPASASALPALVQRDLVVPRRDASLDGVREYVFQHQILHQVTYEGLLKRDRRVLHAKAAAWLAGLTGARASDFLGAAAEHYDKAGDPANASEFFTRAAEHAQARYAHESALGHAAQALALIGRAALAESVMRWRLLDVRERTLDLLGDRAGQRADLDALQEIAEALNDDRRRGELARRRAHLAMRTFDLHAQQAAAREAIEWALRVGDDELRLDAQRLLAIALAYLGEDEAAKALAQSGLSDARASGSRRAEGRFLNALSVIASRQDDLFARVDLGQQYLQIQRELGDRRTEAVALGNLGHAWLDLGETTRGQREVEEALKLHRAVGDRSSEAHVLTNLSELALWQGQDALALAHARAALDIAESVQAQLWQVLALRSLGNAELALGRFAAADAAFERGHALATALDNAGWLDAAAGRAQVALARGDVAAALSHLQALLAHLADGGTLKGAEWPRTVQLTCYRVLAQASDPRAAAFLAAAHTGLLARAATIHDAALRQSFLSHIPVHRDIVAAWAAQQASLDTPR